MSVYAQLGWTEPSGFNGLSGGAAPVKAGVIFALMLELVFCTLDFIWFHSP